jgi:hypothetical protein
MSDCKVMPPSDWVLTQEGSTVGKRVYNELLAKLENIRPGVSSNL